MTFKTYCGFDLPGNDSPAVNSDTFEDCAVECTTAVPRCFAFSWQSSTLTCFLKNAIGTPKQEETILDSAIVDSDSVPTPATDCENLGSRYDLSTDSFNVYCGKDIKGSDITRVAALSMKDCMKQCDSRADCRGIAYEASLVHGYLNCYIKNSNASPDGLVPQSFSIDAAIRTEGAISQSTSSAARGSITSVESASDRATAPTQPNNPLVVTVTASASSKWPSMLSKTLAVLGLLSTVAFHL